MVWQRLALNKTFGDITENLCPYCYCEEKDLFELTGDVPYPSNRPQKKVNTCRSSYSADDGY